MGGTFLGGVLSATLARVLGTDVAGMAAIGGLVCGAIQLYPIRGHVRLHWLWLAITSVGWLLGASVAGRTYDALPAPFGELFFDVAGAGCVGILQWLFMRRYSSAAWQWLVLDLIAWSIFWHFSTEVIVGLGALLLRELR
jgi:hypothetical protein